ncbi:uncharacterized protein [Argopecten irradians]|uniref:uncharacterized protein n=1 Tax=Argopecten irradians TaxID=31199 RepID=UPI003714EEEB
MKWFKYEGGYGCVVCFKNVLSVMVSEGLWDDIRTNEMLYLSLIERRCRTNQNIQHCVHGCSFTGYGCYQLSLRDKHWTNISLFCPLDKIAEIMTDRKAVIKNADMAEDMQQDAVDCATTALEKYNIEKDIAAYIKKEFDKKYNPTWHCIVGRNFGSYVTHETKHFIYFYLGQVAILLFKSG